MRDKHTKMKKTFRKIGMALLAMVACVNFAACSDDDENVSSSYANEILGLWECIEGAENMSTGNLIKFFEGEFDEASYNEGGTLKGKKCLIGWGGDFEVDGEVINDPTELDWNKTIYQYGENNTEFGELYTLDGNTLTVMESDYDRWIGTISIENGIMTYTYKYQNWRVLDSAHQEMTDEEGPYTVKFQKK